MDEEYSAWDYGPGDIQDTTESSQNYWGDQWGNTNDVNPSGWNYGPGNSEDWTQGADGQNFLMGSDGNWAGYQQPNGSFSQYDYSGPSFMDQVKGGVSSLGKGLNSIFPALSQATMGQQRNTESSLAPYLKALALGGGAMMERKGQQQMAQSTPNAVNQIAQRADPFAAERAKYMQALEASQSRLNQFRENPKGNAQFAAVQDAIIDGRRRLGSKQGQRFSPQSYEVPLVAELTKAQLDFEKQMMADRAGLYQPAGANVNPWSGGLEALLAGNKYGAQADSYSALFNALGYGGQSMSNSSLTQDEKNQLMNFLAKQA